MSSYETIEIKEKADALINQINLMKLRLEAIYGPKIKLKWARKK